MSLILIFFFFFFFLLLLLLLLWNRTGIVAQAAFAAAISTSESRVHAATAEATSDMQEELARTQVSYSGIMSSTAYHVNDFYHVRLPDCPRPGVIFDGGMHDSLCLFGTQVSFTSLQCKYMHDRRFFYFASAGGLLLLHLRRYGRVISCVF